MTLLTFVHFQTPAWIASLSQAMPPRVPVTYQVNTRVPGTYKVNKVIII